VLAMLAAVVGLSAGCGGNVSRQAADASRDGSGNGSGIISGGSSGCGTACTGDLVCCSSNCVNTSDDPSNCGGCGITCSAGTYCSPGPPNPLNGGPSPSCERIASDGGADSGSDRGGDSGTMPPSCVPGGPGMTNCGAASENCCTSLEVPGGTYYRTHNTGDSTSGPPDGGWPNEADPATVSGFRLDKYLVTVGRFRQFVAAWNGGAGWLPPGSSGKHTYLNGGQGLGGRSAPSDYFALDS
jgi:formylglycine-generating enzyme